jgi:CheY-like chemotaxis protein
MALKGKEVLIIDDQSDIRMLIRKILENQGLLVAEAESVDDALAWVVTRTPHLVIADLHMPKKNGFDFLEQRQQMPILAAIPVLVASGLRDQKSIYRAIQLGATDYIVKPFTATILIQKIRKALRDQDFIGYTIPKESPKFLTVSVGADISKISDTGFVVESPIKLAEKSKIKMTGEVLEKTGLREDQFLTGAKTGVRGVSGNYISTVNVVGLEKSLKRNRKSEK